MRDKIEGLKVDLAVAVAAKAADSGGAFVVNGGDKEYAYTKDS